MTRMRTRGFPSLKWREKLFAHVFHNNIAHQGHRNINGFKFIFGIS